MWSESSWLLGSLSVRKQRSTSAAITMSGACVRSVLRIALLIAGLGVVLWLAWAARADVAGLVTTIKLGWSIAAILLGVALNVLQGIVFSILLRKHGTSGAAIVHVEAYLLSLVGKYLPGGIWAAVSQATAISGSGSLRAVLLVNLELAAINMLLLAGIGVACVPSLPLIGSGLVICATWGSLAIALRQKTMAIVLNMLAQRFPRLRISVSEESTSSPTWPLAFAFAFAMLTLCAATSSAVILASGQASFDAVPAMLALLCLGWTVGLIAIPVPAGIGVREASTLALWTILPTTLMRGALIAVMLLVRVWQLAVDLLSFGLALLIRTVVNPRSRQPCSEQAAAARNSVDR